MDYEVKKRWLRALRSGRYKQTTGQLKHTSDGETCFCVLGVLCDLCPQKRWLGDSTASTIEGGLGIPSPAVLKWAGFGSSTPPIKDVRIQKLIQMNDSGVDFLELANYIEKAI